MRFAKAAAAAILIGSLYALPTQAGAGTTPTTMPADAARAEVTRDQLNLMNITQAIQRYADGHGGQLPGSLGDTLPYIQQWTAWTNTEHPKLSAAQRAALYLSAGDLAHAGIPREPTAAWINAHTSYIYLGHGGQKIDSVDWGKTVIVYLAPEKHETVATRDGRTVDVYPVAMLDGHAEAESKEHTDPEIANSKQSLSPHG